MKNFVTFVLMIGLFSMSVDAKIIVSKVEYKSGDQTFQGLMAMDSAQKGARPGVVVFHNWMGVTAETEAKITELAKLGYVAMAADLYGKGIRPKNTQEAGALATSYKNDRKLLRERANLALNELAKSPKVDPKKLLASGYCFGGTAALELGRSGANVLGIATFHGGLSNPVPSDAKNIKGQVAVFHGALDPFVSLDEVLAFKKEMDDAKIVYELVNYSGAVHSFTEKGAGDDISKGAAYNDLADKRSWAAMNDFFSELTK